MAKESGVTIAVRVHPQAKRSNVTGMLGSAYKLDVAAPANDGRANEACIELLAEITGITRKNIRLLKGQTSRSKIFEFEGGDEVELRRRLNQAI
jgi:uncharacterized protein (TIGR00251 family)